MKLLDRYLQAYELVHILPEFELVLVTGNNDDLITKFSRLRTIFKHDLLMNLYGFIEWFQATVTHQFSVALDHEIGVNERFVLVEHHFRLKITALEDFRAVLSKKPVVDREIERMSLVA